MGRGKGGGGGGGGGGSVFTGEEGFAMGYNGWMESHTVGMSGYLSDDGTIPWDILEADAWTVENNGVTDVTVKRARSGEGSSAFTEDGFTVKAGQKSSFPGKVSDMHSTGVVTYIPWKR